MVATVQSFSGKATNVGAAKLQAKPAFTLRRFGQAKLSAVSINGLQKSPASIVASRKTVR